VTVQAAAASGNYIAQYQLAQEKLTSGDYADGADLMRKAAQKGLPIAQYALAKLHERGTGVPKDLTLAREWTEKAAAGGNVKAMHDLAVFMAEGEGGEQTYAGAVEWFRKGAEYGVVDSQYNLGVLYEQGLGISPNLTESLFWFDVANRNGDGGAPAKISELIERVSPEAAAQARSRAASWQPAAANAIANGRFGAQPWNIGNPLQVQAVQKALNALGYAAGTPDGIMGNGTAMAIRDYQRANGLPVTGTVTAELIDRLNAGASYGG
jgi:localization factor PodJL